MARKPGAGRKPAKNEVAAGLINALKFCGVIKAPTTTSMVQQHHVFLNAGYAISFDGIVSAGHPIDKDIQGYPHAKLLLEALENTDKTFSWVRHENGTFEIKSDKYNALVPALPYNMVIPTNPALNQGPFGNAEQFVKALDAVGKVAVEAGDIALHSAVRLTSNTAMATDGATIVEALHGNNVPPVILPKQFVTALVKTGKFPVGMGVSADWKSFTVWFEDGSWLRTNTYDSEVWPVEINDTYHAYLNSGGEWFEPHVKLWLAIKSVLPFADDDRRVIVRPGLVRTHVDRNIGAAIEVAEVAFSLDIDGKRLLAVESLAKMLSVKNSGDVLLFTGDNVRGVIAGLLPLPEPEAVPDEPTQGGWGVPTSGEPVSAGGWAIMGAPAEKPAPEAAPAPVSDGWAERAGIPPEGLQGDMEFMGVHPPGVTFEPEDDAPSFSVTDDGVDLGAFNSAAWLETLKDEE